jgi:hypothetical protein
MKINLPAGMTRAFHNVGFQLKKHSPEILVVAGVVGTVASTVLACKATTKVNFVLEETKEKVDIIHAGVEAGEVQGYLENGEVGMIPYTAEDSKKDLTIVYTQTGLKLAKLYAPAVLLGAASIASILGGHHILHKRTLAFAAAYTAADASFKQYRGRVIERLGEKVDKELLYNIKAMEVEETVVNEDGSEVTVKKTVEVVDPASANGLYTFCFDETASGWQRDAEDNKYFLLMQQDYANEKLKAKGRIFLNEVLDMLGLQQCKAGQNVGWVYDSEKGDGYIDFGIFNIHNEANRNFVNGLEKSIWLNFNVDGDIRYTLSPR